MERAQSLPSSLGSGEPRIQFCFFFFFFFTFVLPTCISASRVSGAYRSQTRGFSHMELEITALSHHVVAETELGSSARAASIS